MNAPEPAKSLLLGAYNACKEAGLSTAPVAVASSEDDASFETIVPLDDELANRKKEFLIHLISSFSYWKYENFL